MSKERNPNNKGPGRNALVFYFFSFVIFLRLYYIREKKKNLENRGVKGGI